MIDITFDESGNTGADLLNKEQPVFILASSNYTVEEAERLLTIFEQKQGQEVKFKNIKRRENNHKKIIDFMSQIATDKEKNIVTIYHKEFVLITHIVDPIIESEMHDRGIDIYKKGLNIALSNIHYKSINNLCSKKVSDGFKKSFTDMVRDQKKENIEKFYYYLWQVHGTCTEVKYRQVFDTNY